MNINKESLQLPVHKGINFSCLHSQQKLKYIFPQKTYYIDIKSLRISLSNIINDPQYI